MYRYENINDNNIEMIYEIKCIYKRKTYIKNRYIKQYLYNNNFQK